MSTTPFVHLHVHTEYSLVDSTVRIAPLMARCAEDGGMPAVALTDQNNLFGMVKFFKKAVAAGVKPIIGVDLRIANEDDASRPLRLILLCQNTTGYRNLSQLLTRAFLEGQIRGVPLVRRQWLTREGCEGLIALSGGLHGDVGHALHNGHYDLAQSLLDGWQDVFVDRYYLELIRTGRPGEEECVQACLTLASDTRTPVVASNDVRFLDRDDFNAHEARVCIQEGRGLADPDRPRDYSENQYLHSSAEMLELFADVPEAIENARELARRCNLDLKLGESVLPEFPVPEGQTESGFLKAEARRGLDAQLGRIFEAQSIPDKERDAFSAPYFERLRTELSVISGMGFP